MLKKRMDIEKQLYLFQIFGIVVTAALCLVLMISVTLSRNNRQQEEELLEEVHHTDAGKKMLWNPWRPVWATSI